MFVIPCASDCVSPTVAQLLLELLAQTCGAAANVDHEHCALCYNKEVLGIIIYSQIFCTFGRPTLFSTLIESRSACNTAVVAPSFATLALSVLSVARSSSSGQSTSAQDLHTN